MNTEYYYNGSEWVERELSTQPVTESAKLPKNTVIVTEVDGVSHAYRYVLGKDGYYHDETQDAPSYSSAGGTYPAGYNPEVCRQTTTVTAHTSVTPSFENPFVIRNNYGDICAYKTDAILFAAVAAIIVICHIIALVAFLKGRKD